MSAQGLPAIHAPAIVKLDEVILSADQPEIDFRGIPGGFRNLVIVLTGRTDQAQKYAWVALRCNGDTGANYSYSYLYANAGTPSVIAGTGQTSMAVLGEIVGGGATPAAMPGSLRITVADYARTQWQKTAHSVGPGGATSSGLNAATGAGCWHSTDAINRLTVLTTTGAGDKFKAGTVATLYGEL